jgi:hypothetical protein
MQLLLNPIPFTKQYRVESATRVQQSGQILEYHEVAAVELKLLGIDKSSWVFHLITHSVQTQANNEVFTWARAVNALLDNLVLRVSVDGRIAEILNEAEILTRWPGHKQALQQTYGERPGADAMLTALEQALQTPDFLKKQLSNSGLHDFLFPGLYGDYPESSLSTSKVLSGFFGLLDLPLTLRSDLEAVCVSKI